MPATLTAGNLLDLVALKFPRILTDGFGGRAADEVQAYIWKLYPWKVSIADLIPFNLVVEEPDYGPPVLVVPPDFQGFHQVRLRCWDGRTYPVKPKPDLPISFAPGMPDEIAYMPKAQAFRIHPRPFYSAPDWWIEGEYKKAPIKINNENLNSAIIPWDDMYSIVFRKGLIWQFKQDTPDEMNAFAQFKMLIDEMASSEGLLAGVPEVAPSEGMALGGYDDHWR
jgi:hypothetical protein